MPDLIALDAMGVLFRAGSQVKETLLPFCRAHGADPDPGRVANAYLDATTGRLSSAAFWEALGVPGDPARLDEAYVAAHELSPGATAFCRRARSIGIELACVTNHLVEWVSLLRDRHGLGTWIGSWIVSAEVGARKPDRLMYRALIERTAADPARAWFVDDLPGNVEGARAAGLEGILFGRIAEEGGGSQRRARDFAALGALLDGER